MKAQENVITTRGNGRKHGVKSDGQNIVKTYKEKKVTTGSGRKRSGHRKKS